MSDAHWRQANALFESLLDLSPAEQQARLDAECVDNPELRRTVERLLAADANASAAAFMGQPVAQVGSPTPPNPESTDATGPNSESSQPMPERFGPYRLLHVIGQGGMGTVYAAERDDEAFERRVAIKVISAGQENDEIIQRMQTERRILAQLEHPNIAQIYDAGATEDGLPYFVMEYVDGQPIDVYCNEREIHLDERIALVRKVCAAVDYANRNLVVHRDLKPSNILVTEDGEPKLLDFGIAKWLEPDETAQAAGGSAADSSQGIPPQNPTAPWRRRLTLNYASPEQIRGESISTASDVYSLGVLLYQLLTGSLPRRLDGLTPWQAEQRLTQEEPPRPSTAVETSDAPLGPPGELIFKRLQGDLDAIVLMALRGDAVARYPSAAALAEDLDNYLRGFPVRARRGSWRYRAGKWLRRYRVAAGLGSIILILAAAFLVSSVRSAHRLAQEQERLLTEQAKRERVLDLFLDIFAKASPYAAEGVDLTLRQAVDQQAEQLESGLPDQPAEQAVVLSTLGWVYLDLGQSERSHDYHRRALELRHSHDAEDTEVAESLDGVAASLRDLQELEEAEPISAEALQLYRDAQGTTASQLLRSLNNRVSIFCYLKDWQAAAPLSEEALELSRRVPPEDPENAKALVQRAQVVRGLGDAEGARRLYLEVESAYTKLYGPQHPLLATVFNNLGSIEFGEDNPDQAIDYLRRAEAQYSAAFGETFYGRVYALNNLSLSLKKLGRLDEAEETLHIALEVATKSPDLGTKHLYYGRVASALARLWLDQDRCDEVRELITDQLAHWEAESDSNKGFRLLAEAGRPLLDQCN